MNIVYGLNEIHGAPFQLQLQPIGLLRMIMDNSLIDILAARLAGLPSLQAVGFAYVGAIPQPPTQAIGESTVLLYSNAMKRSLQLQVYPQPGEDAACVINIVNDDSGEAFGLRDWLKQHGIQETEPTRFRLAHYPGDLASRIDGFLSYIDIALSHQALRDVLAGNVWERVHFDWAGMR